MLASIIGMPISLTSSGVSVLTAPWLPTGKNTGVGTGPCGVINSPARALLTGQVCFKWKVLKLFITLSP